jgi:hypothetical protein
MVGTKAVRSWPRKWSRNSSIEEIIFMLILVVGNVDS